MMSEDLATGFYSIGSNFPFYHGVRGARAILFGSLESKEFEDTLVILGWLIGCFVISFLVGLTNVYKRWRKIDEHFLLSRLFYTGAGSRITSTLVMG